MKFDDHHDSGILVEHLFRNYWGAAVASLVCQFGIQELDDIEDAVQDSLLAALRNWPLREIPQNPSGWLFTVARNRVIDKLRSSRKLEKQNEFIPQTNQPTAQSEAESSRFRHEIPDDMLRMMVTLCDPCLSRESQCALTLQVACGFSAKEIAAAYLSTEFTVSKRIARAKKKLLEHTTKDSEPGAELLQTRMGSVLEVIYLLFNEGYSAHCDERLIRVELCAEAVRLVRLLLSSSAQNRPELNALAALLCLQSARLPSRLGTHGELLLLAEQDRALWNKHLISEGLEHLRDAATGQTLSRYHLEAGIAATHATARSFKEIDWSRILFYYDRLLELHADPVITLNRLVAMSMIEGPEFALTKLRANQHLRPIENHYLYHSVYADLYRRQGDYDAAVPHYRRALTSAPNAKVREFLRDRIAECGTNAEAPLQDPTQA